MIVSLLWPYTLTDAEGATGPPAKCCLEGYTFSDMCNSLLCSDLGWSCPCVDRGQNPNPIPATGWDPEVGAVTLGGGWGKAFMRLGFVAR